MELRLPCPCATSTMVHRPQGPTACNCTSPEMTATIHPDIGNAFVRCSLMKCAHPYLYAAMKPICICCQTSSACASQSSNTMFGLNRSSAMQFSINGKKADMYIDMYMSKYFICICVISPCISSIHVSVQSSYNPLTWCLMNLSCDLKAQWFQTERWRITSQLTYVYCTEMLENQCHCSHFDIS